MKFTPSKYELKIKQSKSRVIKSVIEDGVVRLWRGTSGEWFDVMKLDQDQIGPLIELLQATREHLEATR